MRRSCAVLCYLFILSAPAFAQAYIKFTTGEVWIEGTAGRRAARSGLQAAPGEKVTTGANGRAVLMLADASTVTLASSSILKIERSRVSTTAVSLKRGSLSAVTHPQRWADESFNISTPVITTGVRGTEFSVEVVPSGEARIHVDTGVVTAGDAAIAAGEGASASFEGGIQPEREPEAAASFQRWRNERRDMLTLNRKRVVEGISGLLRHSLQRRKELTQNILKTIRETLEALKEHEDDLRDAGVAKIARVVATIRNGVDRAREMIANDREGELREETLRDLLIGGKLSPFAALSATLILNRADKERAERERGLKHLDDAVEKLGGGLALLAAAAASEPGRDRVVAKIITQGLGMPLDAEPIPAGEAVFHLMREDLLWSPGRVRKMVRTVRGREDYRTPLEVRIESNGSGLSITRAPLAFDSTTVISVVPSDTCLYLEKIEGLQMISRERPAMMYRFPMAVGDTWVAWTVPGLFNRGKRIERAVTAAERIRTPAGVFDCLRVETRFHQGNQKKAPLIHIEWLSPGAGQVREISFRGEIRSIAWDELVE